MRSGLALTLTLAFCGCAPVLDANSALWTVDVTDEPLPVQNPDSGFFELEEWCPSLYFNNHIGPGGVPTVAAKVRAPHRVNAPFFTEDEDVYIINPFFSAAELGAPLAFDIGPIGTFYEDAPHAYEVTGAQGEVTPASMNVTRTIVGGSVQGDDEFTVEMSYQFDCEGGRVSREDITCDCEAERRVTITAVASS